MITYEKISPSSFIAGDTFRWYAKFTDEKMNILGGYAPFIDWNFERPVEYKEISITPVRKIIEMPVDVQYVTKLNTTIIDNDNKDFIKILNKWVKSLPASKSKAINFENISKYTKELYIYIQDKTGKTNYKYRFLLLPTSSFTDNGTSDSTAKTYPYTFNVAHFEIIEG